MPDHTELMVEQAKKISDLEKYIKALKNENEELRIQREQSDLQNEMLQTRLEEALAAGRQPGDVEEEPTLASARTAVPTPGSATTPASTLTSTQASAANPTQASTAAVNLPAPSSSTASVSTGLGGARSRVTPIAHAPQNSTPASISTLTNRMTLSPRDVEAKSEELLEASKEGRVQDVYRLLREGADASYKGFSDKTALHQAAMANHLAVATALISFGAPLNAKGRGGSTPLHYAAEQGHTEVVLTLLHAGADYNARAIGSYTPLHSAVLHGHKECADALIRAGADPNAANNAGNTPLHTAALGGKYQGVPALLRSGANPNLRNIWGKTARDLALDDKIRQLLR